MLWYFTMYSRYIYGSPNIIIPNFETNYINRNREIYFYIPDIVGVNFFRGPRKQCLKMSFSFKDWESLISNIKKRKSEYHSAVQ